MGADVACELSGALESVEMEEKEATGAGAVVGSGLETAGTGGAAIGAEHTGTEIGDAGLEGEGSFAPGVVRLLDGVPDCCR